MRFENPKSRCPYSVSGRFDGRKLQQEAEVLLGEHAGGGDTERAEESRVLFDMIQEMACVTDALYRGLKCRRHLVDCVRVSPNIRQNALHTTENTLKLCFIANSTYFNALNTIKNTNTVENA